LKQKIQYILTNELCHPVRHYGTFLIAQHASKPDEYKGVD